MVALNLTALMDILSNLLFFLLAAYAARPPRWRTRPNCAARSTSQVRLQLQLTISITKTPSRSPMSSGSRGQGLPGRSVDEEAESSG